MIDHGAATIAFRNRVLSMTAVTTGLVQLSATATGYARATGSFVADGFAVGMEFLASGFTNPANNGYRVIDDVQPLAIVTSAATTAEAPGAGRSLVVGLPEGRAFENREFVPVGGRPYVRDEFVPSTMRLLTAPAQGGYVEETGFYIVTWYGLSNTGVSGIRNPIERLRQLFTPGTAIAVGGVPVEIRGDVAPQTSQLLPQGTGWSRLALQVPWRAVSLNTVSA